MKQLQVLSLAAALSLSGVAGIPVPQKDRVLAGMPLWTGERSFAEKHYVYRTADKAEFVIAYPADLEIPGRGKQLVVDRFRLQNEVDATVTSWVARVPGQARLTYSYKVANSSAAREAIWSWSLIGSPADNQLTVETGGWRGYRAQAAVAAFSAIPDQDPGVFVSWTGPDSAIAPGQSNDGFRLTSDFLPGITTAAFVGGDAIHVSAELPLAVSNQLAPFFKPQFTNELELCMAPRYPPASDFRQWADLFSHDLRALNTALPATDTPATRRLLTALSQPPEHFAAPPNVTPLEASMWEAAELVHNLGR